MQQSLFFNTTSLVGQDLKLALNKASNQNDKILIFFKQHYGMSFSPSEVHKQIFEESTPLTSVRRSITSLTDSNELVKTNIQIDGVYGRPEYKWKLNN